MRQEIRGRTLLLVVLAATLWSCNAGSSDARGAGASGEAPGSPDVPDASAALQACADLAPVPTPPADALQVTAFGAVPDDELPDDAAIAAAIAALAPGQWLVFAPGRYIQARSILIDRPGVTLWGKGATIHASNPADQTLGLRADNVRVYGFELTAATDVRREAAEHARVSVYRDWRQGGLQQGNVVRGLTISTGGPAQTVASASASGILVSAATRFTIAENTVVRSLADGIHVTGGSRQGRVLRNTVRETGDDMIAMVSYLGEGWQQRLRADPVWRQQVLDGEVQVSEILVQGNDLASPYWGRGLSVVGSRNITVRGNRIQGTAYGAGVLVAQEGGYFTPGPRNVLVESNQIERVQTDAPTYVPASASGLRSGHGAIEIHAIQNTLEDAADSLLASALQLRGVALRGNQIRQVATDGVRIGAETAPGLIQEVLVADNQLAQVGGKAVLNLLADGSSARCTGNTLDGKAVDGACTLGTVPEVAGAKLECTALPS